MSPHLLTPQRRSLIIPNVLLMTPDTQYLYTQAAAALEVKRSAELEAQGKKKKVEEELAALKRQVAEETSALMLKQQQQEMMKQMQVLYMQHHL